MSGHQRICRASNFSVISQNIRSIYRNFDDLQTSISSLEFKVDAIILTECHLNVDKSIPQLDNHNSFVTTNHLNKSDGVVIYLKKYEAKVLEVKLMH